jgi:hypothetical protein
MANWLDRAKREIPQGAGRATAIADERNPTAVTAVREPGEPEISRASIGSNGSAPVAGFREIEVVNKATVPMTPGEESAIRVWLAHIEETDPAIIADLLDKCRTDADARGYFIGRAAEVPHPLAFDDDRRRCDQCANLTGRGVCLAARRGEIVASRTYEPVRDLPRRCEGYGPRPEDTDRRTGPERWPGLIQKGDDHGNA